MPDGAVEDLLGSLPEPLRFNDGNIVATAADWRERRRAELLERFAREMYGRLPARPAAMRFETLESSDEALGGAARRRQIHIHLGDAADAKVDLLLYLPTRADGPTPVILGLNNWGNQTVTADPAVQLTPRFISVRPTDALAKNGGVVEGRATDRSRGVDASRWPIERLLSRGYGVATIGRGDLDADVPGRPDYGVRSRFPDLMTGGDNLSTIGIWAWGLCRGLDALAAEPGVDATRVAVFGFSRLGKAAVWAAAIDERFALLISAESATGGAKLFRHVAGEKIRQVNERFPHWFCENFRAYNDRDASMPFDQHEVLALVAPRPIYASSSEGKLSFVDPLGEFLALKAAGPVYRLFSAGGVPADEMPPLDHSTHGQLGYHHRTGGHDVTAFDWDEYLDFCDVHLRPTRPATKP